MNKKEILLETLKQITGYDDFIDNGKTRRYEIWLDWEREAIETIVKLIDSTWDDEIENFVCPVCFEPLIKEKE